MYATLSNMRYIKSFFQTTSIVQVSSVLEKYHPGHVWVLMTGLVEDNHFCYSVIKHYFLVSLFLISVEAPYLMTGDCIFQFTATAWP